MTISLNVKMCLESYFKLAYCAQVSPMLAYSINSGFLKMAALNAFPWQAMHNMVCSATHYAGRILEN